MKKSTLKFGMEMTEATIIGGDFKTGQLLYAGVTQGGRFHGDTDAELRDKAKTMKAELRARWTPEWFDGQFTNAAKWELRIWD